MKSKFCSKEIFVSILFVQFSLNPVWVAATHGFVLLPDPIAGIYPLEYITGVLIGLYPKSSPQTSPSPNPGLLRLDKNPATPTFNKVVFVISMSVFKR